jgi:acyl-coenzyme A thioesterase PaaI-like protein
MQANTHLANDKRLCGEPCALGPGKAEARLVTVPEMAADDRGLVHGSFVFGVVDYAAMLAVNDPNVVLGGAELRFLAPVTVGEEVRAHAEITAEKGRKRTLTVEARVGDKKVLSGTVTAFVLDQHVLDA